MKKKLHIVSNHPKKFCKARTFDRSLIPPECIKICEKLHANGYDAWLVGGCIRDLILGQCPKDFDITTVATPQQIKAIFKRQCRIIGRRFQIVHIAIRAIREPIEVSTLRAMHTQNPRAKDGKYMRKINQQGRIEQDNVFGHSLYEDAHRRDFTVNALYYHPISDQCVDFVGGIKDIKEQVIRSIGDPKKRFSEDPLRMIRAIRFRAKTGLYIHTKDRQAIATCSHQLKAISNARLLDESRKLFVKGHALASYHHLKDHQLLHTLLPYVKPIFTSHESTFSQIYGQFIELALANTDKRIAQGKPVSMPFLFASLLWPDVQYRHQNIGEKNNKGLQLALCQQVCWQQRETIRLSKYWIGQIIDIWLTHERLIKHFLHQGSEKQANRLLAREKFRAAYDFLCLRAESGESPDYLVIAHWWTKRQETAPTLNQATSEKAKNKQVFVQAI